MIIEASRRLASQGVGEVADHVLRGPANESISVLQGSEQALHDWVRDARTWRRRFAFRHFKISPSEDLTPEQEGEMLDELATEFAFDRDDALVVRHQKPRHNDAASEFHIHVLAPEVNPVNGRVLSSKWNYARHEKVARVLAARWGHRTVQGEFNKEVIAALRREGRDDDADLVLGEGLDITAKPQAPYTSQLVQEVKRKTARTMAEIAEAVRDARMLSATPNEFTDMLAEQGLRVAQGEKAARWVIEAQTVDGDWTFAGALHRITKRSTDETNRWMQGFNPALEQENDEHERHNEGKLEDDGLHRPARGARRPHDAQTDGQEGNDAWLCRSPGSRGKNGPVDGLAGHGLKHRRRKRPGPHRGTADAAGRNAEGHAGTLERAGFPAVVTERARASLRSREESRGDGSTTTKSTHDQGLRCRRLTSLLEVAAVQQHFSAKNQVRKLAAAFGDIRPPELAPLLGATNRSVTVVEPDVARRERRMRFHLLLIRRAYPLAQWLPPLAVANLSRVDYDPESARLMLTLWSGTRILDAGDRLTVRGVVNDVALHELAECVERREWERVEVTGDRDFRMQMSRELIMRGIEVVDCPLAAWEIQEIQRSRIREEIRPSMSMR